MTTTTATTTTLKYANLWCSALDVRLTAYVPHITRSSVAFSNYDSNRFRSHSFHSFSLQLKFILISSSFFLRYLARPIVHNIIFIRINIFCLILNYKYICIRYRSAIYFSLVVGFFIKYLDGRSENAA